MYVMRLALENGKEVEQEKEEKERERNGGAGRD